MAKSKVGKMLAARYEEPEKRGKPKKKPVTEAVRKQRHREFVAREKKRIDDSLPAWAKVTPMLRKQGGSE
jgi:hypothetical protein